MEGSEKNMKDKLLIIYLVGIFCLLLPVSTTFAKSNDLQKMIDETPAGEVLELEAKIYEGNIRIAKPITIIGQEGTRIKGDGTASVIEIESDDVTLDTLYVSHSGMDQSSGEEFSGIRVMANSAILKNIKMTDVFHGILISRVQDTVIENAHIIGHHSESLASQGNGITIKRAKHTTITNSYIEKTRDGIYVEYADNNIITNNKATETRYGLHYMYSNYNTIENNEFVRNVGGAAIMHSDHITLKNNTFSYNQGSRSFGLIIQSSRDLEVKENQFFLNQRGLYLEQSTSNRIEENEFFKNQIGIELWTSSTAHTFIKNKFGNNNMDVVTIGGVSLNEWHESGVGNYWDVPLVDLDQNGVGDQTYQYSSAIGNLLEENELAYLFLNSPALRIYEMINTITSDKKIMAEDLHPLVQKQVEINMWLILPLLFIVASLIYVRKRRTA